MRKIPILFLSLLFCVAGTFSLLLAEDADLLFVNGTVYTVDANDTVARSLAVKDGKIVFVGGAAEGEKFKGDRTEVVDLRGGMLLPGFFDTHIHVPGPLVVDLMDFSLLGVEDLAGILKVVRDTMENNPDNQAYHGFGFPTGIFTGEEAVKGPRKEHLDQICSDKPIVILAYDGHSTWMNSKAFEAAGITKETPSPKGGAIEHDDKTGELWGTLKDNANSLAPQNTPSLKKMVAVVDKFQKLMNSYGYTSLMSVSAMESLLPVPWEAYAALEKEGRLTLRINASHSFESGKDFDAQMNRLKELREKHESRMLRLTTAKIFSDGVLDTRTAYLTEPYGDNTDENKDYRGDRYWPVDELNDTVARLNAAGLQVHVHAIGDAAAKQVLDAFQYAAGKVKAGDYRNMITHLQLVRPEDVLRFEKLDVIACVQPYWFFKEPGVWPQVEQVAIGDRAERMYPLKSFFEAGVIVTSSSDSPVTMIPYPLIAMETAATRNLIDGSEYGLPDLVDMDDPRFLLWPEERVSVKQAIRSFTANSAFAMFSDEYCGTLEVGKAADMVILDKNILDGSPLGIHKTKVLRTYLEGKPVYEGDEEDAQTRP